MVPPSYSTSSALGIMESVSYVMRMLLLPNILVGLLALTALLILSLREREYGS